MSISTMNTNDNNQSARKCNIRPLPTTLQDIAIRELNEVPERIADDLLAMHDWIATQPHLRARYDDQWVIAFLRGCKFSLEKAKRKIDRYYTLKEAMPEIFNDRRRADDPLVLEIIRMGVILRLPLDADDDGPCMTIIRAGSYDTEKYKFADIVRVGSMFGDIMCMEDDNATVSGYVEIMDMSHVTATHFFQLKPELLRRFAIFADEAMPSRQRGTHFINVPTPFEKGFNTLKGFFPAKMLSRISVSSQPEAILDYVPQRYLPVEYGGENGTIQEIIERMEAKMLQYREFFEAESNFGTDEKLRIGTSFTLNSDFGIEGSFRKIQID